MTMTLQEAIWENVPFEGIVAQTTGLDLSGYSHPLPNGITQIGNLDLRGYNHPLPNGITKIKHLWLQGYNHPLPNSITQIGETYLEGYDHLLPNSITKTDYLNLSGYNHPLPSSITETGGLFLIGYNHPLPNSITKTEYLFLRGYDYPLPSSITKTGKIHPEGYNHPLPSGITETGNLDPEENDVSESIGNYPFFGIEEYTIIADVSECEDNFELVLSPRKFEENTNWHGGITLQTMIVEDSIEKIYTKLKMLFDLGLFHPSQFEPMGNIFDENADIIGELDWSKYGNFWDTDIEPEVK